MDVLSTAPGAGSSERRKDKYEVHIKKSADFFKHTTFRNLDRFVKVNSNTLILGGGDYADMQYLKDIIVQRRFIGNVDMLGLSFEEDIVATGLGLYIAVPMMREAKEARGNQPLDKAGAVEILKKCLEVLFYRDCLSHDR
ncbi:unnamed protein product, partial [Nesidiocoris tenuis]